MLETFVNDKYSAITFSAIDRKAAGPDREEGRGLRASPC